jgi:hypothetical protein
LHFPRGDGSGQSHYVFWDCDGYSSALLVLVAKIKLPDMSFASVKSIFCCCLVLKFSQFLIDDIIDCLADVCLLFLEFSPP